MSEILNYMRPQDVELFCQIAQFNHLYILVRRTNPASLQYIGVDGFTPKPCECKPKTADQNVSLQRDGQQIESHCAGLVVNPERVGDGAFKSADKAVKARSFWAKYGRPLLETGRYQVQEQPASPYFGCLMWSPGGLTAPAPTAVGPVGRRPGSAVHNPQPQRVARTAVPIAGAQGGIWLSTPQTEFRPLICDDPYQPPGAAYIHGDYDLYAVVHRAKPGLNEIYYSTVGEGGTPHTYSPVWIALRRLINNRIGAEMIQHGEQDTQEGHSDETVDMFTPYPQYRVITLRGREMIRLAYQKLFQGRQTAEELLSGSFALARSD